MMKSVIVKTRRCMFAGPRFVLMGYDADDKEVYGIGYNGSKPVDWLRGGSPRQDLKRLKESYDEYHAQAAAEAAAT